MQAVLVAPGVKDRKVLAFRRDALKEKDAVAGQRSFSTYGWTRWSYLTAMSTSKFVQGQFAQNYLHFYSTCLLSFSYSIEDVVQVHFDSVPSSI
jgi:hypothetical protein